MGNFSTLKSNPVFQLSLASKELFHSNFLYWLATDPKTTPIFIDVLKGIGAVNLSKNYNLQNYAVCREKNHFDLSIWTIKNSNSNQNEQSQDELENSSTIMSGKIDSACSKPFAVLDKVVFVLENKFKSIPEKEQLDDYISQVFKINDPGGLYTNTKKQKNIKKNSKEAVREVYNIWKGNNQGVIIPNTLGCEFILLSLATNFPQKKDIISDGVWGITDYSTLASTLINNKIKSGFRQDLIGNYHAFISSFSADVNTDLNKSQYVKDVFNLNNGIAASYATIRMHDIWQKLVLSNEIMKLIPSLDNLIHSLHQCSNKHVTTFADDKYIFEGTLRNKVTSRPQARAFIHVGLDYGTSGASLNVKYKLDDEFAFIIEIQGNQYRRGILRYKKSPGYTSSTGTYSKAIGKFNYLRDFFTINNVKPTIPYKNCLQSNGCVNKAKFYNYGQSSKIHMIYQSVSLSGGNNVVTLTDLEQAIIYDMREILTRYH